MHYWLQFVTVPTVDTPGSLIAVHFDDGLYLFGNIPEGTQRACIEQGLRTAKTKEVFLTGKTEWKNTGGLLGLVLSMGEIQSRQQAEAKTKSNGTGKLASTVVNRLGIHGAPNLLHTLAVGRRFIFRKNMPLNVDEFNDTTPKQGLEPTWTDANLNVWQIGTTITTGRIDRSEHKDDDDVRKSIISKMFDSDWRTDSLMEQPLKDCSNVSQIFVRNPQTRAIEKYQGPRPQSPDADPNLIVLTRKPWPGALVTSLPPASLSDTALCYIVKTHNQRGQFNAKKATELGVKSGPLFGKLANGESVQANDGSTVTPDMVLGAERPGVGFAVISLPSEEYIDKVLNRPEWSTVSVMDNIDLFCWQLGAGLSTDPRILKFCERFPAAKHFVISSDHCANQLVFDGAAANAIRLSRLAPKQFKVPVHDNVSATGRQNHLFSSSDATNGSPFIPAAPRLRLQVGPTYRLLEEAAQPLNTKEVVEDIPLRVIDLAKQGRERIEENRDLNGAVSKLPGGDAEILTLGTGSSSPSKYRSLSGTLLRVPGYGSYLLDCGEGTLGQLRRVYEPQELTEVLRDLKMIWISHLHADHHLGTISLIRAWHEAVHGSLLQEAKEDTNHTQKDVDVLSSFSQIDPNDPRLAIVSHRDMLNVLFEYSSAENFGFDKCLPLQAHLSGGEQPKETIIALHPERVTEPKAVPPDHPIMNKHLGLKKLSFCRVSHCHGAMAVSFEFDNGFKISYSGDCRPSKRFAEIGAGSTVLIHEATFDDELQGEASAKKHSTTSEAIGVGAAMGAKGVILTHFSQRYAKIPVMSTLHPLQVDFEDAVADPETADGLPGLTQMKNSSTQNLDNVQKSLDVPMTDFDLQPDVPMDVAPTKQTSSEQGLKTTGPSLTTYVDTATTSHKETAVPSRDMKVCVAFDYMRIRVDEIADMVHYTPALVELFNSEKDNQSDSDSNDEGSSTPRKDQMAQAGRTQAKQSTSKPKASQPNPSGSKDSSQTKTTKKGPSDIPQASEDGSSLSSPTTITKAQLRRERKQLAQQERKAAAAAAAAQPNPSQPTTSKRKPSSPPPHPQRRPPPSPRTTQSLSHPVTSPWNRMNNTVARQIREDETTAAK